VVQYDKVLKLCLNSGIIVRIEGNDAISFNFYFYFYFLIYKARM